MATDLYQAIDHIEAAEELFALLDVAFDPALLAAHRIGILKRFGREVEVLEGRNPPLCEEDRLPLYASALERTHALYARGGSEVDPIIRMRRSQDVVAVDRLRRVGPRAEVT